MFLFQHIKYCGVYCTLCLPCLPLVVAGVVNVVHHCEHANAQPTVRIKYVQGLTLPHSALVCLPFAKCNCDNYSCIIFKSLEILI